MSNEQARDLVHIAQRRNNHVLAIGIDEYADFPALENCQLDIAAFIEVLLEQYQFDTSHVTTLFNADATRNNILNSFERLSEQLTDKDNLLIYFAGHGFYQRRNSMGFLVPTDAKKEMVPSLIYNSTIKDYISRIGAHHIFLMVDSCFSGDFILRSDHEKVEGIEQFAERVDAHPSRYGLAAGRIEKVSDGVIGNHSPFSKSVISFLKNNPAKQFPVSELIQHVSKQVTYNADQTPIGGILVKTDNQGGQFVFKKKDRKASQPKKEEIDPLQQDIAAWRMARRKNTLEGYRAYLDAFGQGDFVVEAVALIEQLERQTRQQRELEMWRQAKQADSLEVYQDYLNAFPKGEFYFPAQRAIKRIERIQAKKVEEELRQEKLRSCLHEAEQLFEEKEYKEAIDCWEEALILVDGEKTHEIRDRITQTKREIYRTNKVNDLLAEADQLKKENELDKVITCLKKALTLANQEEMVFINRFITETEKAIKDKASRNRGATKANKTRPLKDESPLKELGIEMVKVEGGLLTREYKTEVIEKKLWGLLKDSRSVTRYFDVKLSDFEIGKYPITQAQWKAVMGTNPSKFKGCDQCPVDSISWNDVQEFIQKLNERTDGRFSLPTEGQWEYAARGGMLSKAYKYAGSNKLEEVGWYAENSNRSTHPVGQKQPNELGIYDMSGNVWEWCEDWYSGTYYQECDKQGIVEDPKGPKNGKSKVVRGGSWTTSIDYSPRLLSQQLAIRSYS